MNPTIFRTTNPIDFRQVDGVYIDERRPPGRVRGIGNDIVCVIGECERGPVDTITAIGSTKEFERIFGGVGTGGVTYPVAIALRNKQFGRLRVIRVSNATQTSGNVTVSDGAGTPVNIIRFEANSPGAWGNSLSVTIGPASNGNAAHFNVTVLRNGVAQEVIRNLNHGLVPDDAYYSSAIPISSDFIRIRRLAAGDGRPVDGTYALTNGADGTFADSDYTGAAGNSKGMRLLYGTEAANIRWVFVAENASANVNAALRTLCEETKTKIAIICGAKANTKAQALTDVVDYRSDRVVYVYPWVKTFIAEANAGKGGLLDVSPTSFAAAACAALAPGVDPAGVNAEPYLTGIRELLDKTLERDDYVSFNEQGIMALQFAAERQRYGFRSGVLTTLDSALQMIFRRTMTDFLQESQAVFLAEYQNRPLTRALKLEVKAAISDFLDFNIRNGLLPSASDLVFGETKLLPYEIDIDSGNSPADEASGLFVVIERIRIYASTRFIVLRTEIGEGVEITVE